MSRPEEEVVEEVVLPPDRVPATHTRAFQAVEKLTHPTDFSMVNPSYSEEQRKPNMFSEFSLASFPSKTVKRVNLDPADKAQTLYSLIGRYRY